MKIGGKYLIAGVAKKNLSLIEAHREIKELHTIFQFSRRKIQRKHKVKKYE